jgi:CheY-like chemotaxis protein
MYDVVLANSGRKALEIIAMENPDVILLDYEMPLMKGPETMRHIREKRGFENIPIIFLTGVNDRAQITAALALKPAGYLLKPVNKEKLFNTVLDVLNSADNNLIY